MSQLGEGKQGEPRGPALATPRLTREVARNLTVARKATVLG